MQIVDALGEDGMLRYYGMYQHGSFVLEIFIVPGFSYGTALGATIAAMFPDRIDKMVLDGVVNVHQYYAGM